jgi:competence protein ComEC
MTMKALPHPQVHRPFIPLAVTITGGIVLGAGLPGHFWWASCCALVFGGILVRSILRRKPSIIAPLFFGLLCGYLSIQPWVAVEMPDQHVSRFADRGHWRLEGVAVDSPRHRQGRWQFTLSATALENTAGSHAVCGLVKVSGRGESAAITAGDGVSVAGRLRSIRSFINPGGFDYKRHMALKGVHARIFAKSGSLQRMAAVRGGPLGTALRGIRQFLSARLEAALPGFSPETVALLRLVLLGDRSALTPDLRSAFNRAGVGHVLAISGLHVGMVAAFVFAVARWSLSWVPVLLTHAWTRKGAALVSFCAVIAYGVLAGLSPSTQRAMLMVSVFLARFWIGRPYDWFNALAAAALVIMTIHPPAVLGISFQLSFTAVLALIAGTAVASIPASDKAAVIWKRILGRLWALIWISLLAMLGTLPLVMRYFNLVSLVGVAANLAVVPLVGMVVLPLGLAGMVAAGCGIAFLPACCWKGSALAMALVRLLVEWISGWSWAAIECVTPTVFEMGLYYAMGMVLLFWRRLAFRRMVLIAVLFLWALDGAYWTYQRFGREDLRVTAMDVGQGSASLLELPGGTTILADGGGYSDNRLFDVGMRIVAPVLRWKKIKTVDLVILSHPNSDHLNGLLYILEHFTVREVWDNGEAVSTAGYGQWRRLIAEKKIQRTDFRTLPRRRTYGGVELEILSPPVDFLERRQKDPWRDVNNNSLVFKIRYGPSSLLFTGDVGTPAELEMVRLHGAEGLRSSVLMVPHHGSGGSSSRLFIRAVSPAHAVISCGWMNRFGFPAPVVIRRLREARSRIWLTARSGAVEIVLSATGRASVPGPSTETLPATVTVQAATRGFPWAEP